ncbi:MAG TPA: PKD domain-containing protein [Bacteroidia bacterium]|jgi:PKD repeat protein|nr:PKD domain-containing protein [Bacteroidia bacterium]
MKYVKRILFIFITYLISFQSISQIQRNGYPETQHLAPQADFGWSNLCFGDSTYFINQTIRGTFYLWHIVKADTDTIYTSTKKNISFLFDSVGYYTVCLQANNGHLVTQTKTIYVDSIISTTANFSFMHCSNHFINMSSCASTFKWDLGDGITSTDAFPVHEYADTGHYTVKLISYNGLNSDTITKKIFIDCEHFPNPTFTYRISYDTVFIHLIDDHVHTWHTAWLIDTLFNVFNVTDTFYVFKDTGTYDIVFYSLSNCLNTGSDQIVQVVFPKKLNYSSSFINIFPNPVSNNDYLDMYYNADSSGTVQLNIYNALGQEVWQRDDYFQAGLNERKISIMGLDYGCYFITCNRRTQIIRAKFIVRPF